MDELELLESKKQTVLMKLNSVFGNEAKEHRLNQELNEIENRIRALKDTDQRDMDVKKSYLATAVLSDEVIIPQAEQVNADDEKQGYIDIHSEISKSNAYQKRPTTTPEQPVSPTNSTAQSLYEQGVHYYNGDDEFDQNYGKAVECFQKALEQGSVDAYYTLGLCYLNGNGVIADEAKGKELLQKAIDNGNADACFMLGLSYYEGKYITRDVEKAYDYIKKAALMDNEEALAIVFLWLELEERHGDLFEVCSFYQQRNHPDATAITGLCYIKGYGTEKDVAKGLDLLQKSVNMRCRRGFFYLGDCYENGIGVSANADKAFELYEQAAFPDFPEAVYRLSCCYEKGIGCRQSSKDAFETLASICIEEESVEYPEYYCKLGTYYKNGFGCKQSSKFAKHFYDIAFNNGWVDAAYQNALLHFENKAYKRGTQYLIQAYESHHAKACLALADIAYGGKYGYKADFDYALKKYLEYLEMDSDAVDGIYFRIGKCYEKKADYQNAYKYYAIGDSNNDCDAQFSLGYLFHLGNGFAKDINRAIYWYNKAAANGNGVAYNNLGVIYKDGNGVPVDYRAAKSCFEKAIQMNCKLGYFNMGELYHNMHDYKTAFSYFQKGIETKHAASVNYLGIYYENGYCVAKDINKALQYYIKAGELGSSDALNNAGVLYYNYSDRKDKAKKYFEKAAKANNALAIQNLRTLRF